jgi:hypothetical protein
MKNINIKMKEIFKKATKLLKAKSHSFLRNHTIGIEENEMSGIILK